MIKTYKQYNESVKDLLQPKSKDEMIKALEGLSDNKKIEYIIIKYQLDYDLLPRNNKGICTYYGNLNCSNNQLTSLPDNLTVEGYLYCYDNKLTNLPENLVVEGDLNCSFNRLKSLPDNLIVKGYLDCRYNQLKKLPENLVVKGDLYCHDNLLPKDTKKPKGVKGGLLF